MCVENRFELRALNVGLALVSDGPVGLALRLMLEFITNMFGSLVLGV